MNNPDTEAKRREGGTPSPARAGRHFRSNVVAYLALAVAVGSGGSYALAATTSNGTNGRRVRRQRQRCHAPRQAPALRAWSNPYRAEFGARPPNGERLGGSRALTDTSLSGTGMSVSHTGVGVYNITVTAANCRDAATTRRWSASMTSAAGGSGNQLSFPVAWT